MQLHVPIEEFLVERLHKGECYMEEWLTTDQQRSVIRSPSAPDFFPLGPWRYRFVSIEVQEVVIPKVESEHDSMFPLEDDYLEF